MSNKRWIITGNKGFIGTNFCNLLAIEGQEFYGIDAEIAGSNKFETIGTNACKKQYKYDLCDRKLYGELQKDFLDDYKGEIVVVHFAAFSHVDQSIKTPVSLVTKNIQSTYTIAEWCARNNVDFVNIGTDEVFGELDITSSLFTEQSPLLPRNPYSSSKAASELLIQSLKVQYPTWKVVCTNCVNNFGEYQDYSKLIPVCIDSILHNKKIPVYGKGEQIRSWIDVKTHNNTVYEIIQNFNKLNTSQLHKFCIGSDIELTNIALIKFICKQMNKTREDCFEFIPDPRGNSHDFRYAVDCSKVEKFLGHSISIPLEQFLIRLNNVIEFYKEYLKDKTKYWKASNE